MEQAQILEKEEIKNYWERLVSELSNQFAPGETLDLDGIIFLIGIQELGKIQMKFK